jgi:hypothetical protein
VNCCVGKHNPTLNLEIPPTAKQDTPKYSPLILGSDNTAVDGKKPEVINFIEFLGYEKTILKRPNT